LVRKTNPTLVIFWERNPTDGVTDNINPERFTGFASLGSASLVESKHVGYPASKLESAPNNNILDLIYLVVSAICELLQ
jgi:hypothetical protein